jgi:hypothetical protein
MNSQFTRSLAKIDPKVQQALAKAQDEINRQETNGKKLTDAQKNKIFATTCAQLTDNYAAYWNRQDGYFDSMVWWHDENSRNEAATVLNAMGKVNGTLNLNDYISGEVDIGEQRILQTASALALAVGSGGQKTSYSELLSNLQNEKTKAGMDSYGYEEIIPAELIGIMQTNYNYLEQNSWFFRVSQTLEGGVENIVQGGIIIGGGLLMNMTIQSSHNE